MSTTSNLSFHYVFVGGRLGGRLQQTDSILQLVLQSLEREVEYWQGEEMSQRFIPRRALI